MKYIALLALAKIVPSHPYLVSEYQDTILASIDDQDISIRMRALDLLSAMVSRSIHSFKASFLTFARHVDQQTQLAVNCTATPCPPSPRIITRALFCSPVSSPKCRRSHLRRLTYRHKAPTEPILRLPPNPRKEDSEPGLAGDIRKCQQL